MEIPIELMVQTIAIRDVIVITANPDLSSAEPHLYICIGRFEDKYQFVIASTQHEAIHRRIAAQGFSTQTVVNINPSPECPFHKQTTINCNNVKSYTTAKLIELMKGNFQRTSLNLPQYHYESIINAVCMSEIVEQDFIDHLNRT